MSGQHTGALGGAYFANGADNHIVDSMVAGTLDDGPILLVQPDGKIPESVVEFIKKTLPGFFGALGGTGAVPDSTVNEAWQIKALANKWDSSFEVPDANKNVRELEKLVYGINPESGDTRLDSKQFAGLKEVIKKAKAYRDTWSNEVRNLELNIESQFLNANKDGVLGIDQVHAKVTDLLSSIYGVDVVRATLGSSDYANFLKGDSKKNEFTGVNYEAIEATKAYQDKIRDPKKELVSMWKSQKQDSNMNVNDVLTQLAAKLSQVRSDSTDVNGMVALSQTSWAGNKDVPLKVVLDLANATVKTDEDWFDYAKTQLGIAKGVLRGELDKIDSKSMLRLGGKDRFETAQLIANQWAKLYGAEYLGRHDYDGGLIGLDHKFFEAYVANGTRLPDALTAGQLTRGPILLVRGNEKTKADLPEFTVKVAQRLQHWSDKKHAINMYGIGGKAILADTSLEAITTIANGGTTIEKDADSKDKPGKPGVPASKFQPDTKNAFVVVGQDSAAIGFTYKGNPVVVGLDKVLETACANAKLEGVALAKDVKPGELCKIKDGKLTIDGSKLALVKDAKTGKITLSATYEGETATLEINVYSKQTDITTGTAMVFDAAVKNSAGTAVTSAEVVKDAALPVSIKVNNVPEGAKLVEPKVMVDGKDVPARVVEAQGQFVAFDLPKGSEPGAKIEASVKAQKPGEAPSNKIDFTAVYLSNYFTDITVREAKAGGAVDEPAEITSVNQSAGVEISALQAIGSDGKPVDGAKFTVDGSSPLVKLEKANAQGKFEAASAGTLAKFKVTGTSAAKIKVVEAGGGQTLTATENGVYRVTVKLSADAITGTGSGATKAKGDYAKSADKEIVVYVKVQI